MNLRWDQRPKICWAEWACNISLKGKALLASFQMMNAGLAVIRKQLVENATLQNYEFRGDRPCTLKEFFLKRNWNFRNPISSLFGSVKWLKHRFIPTYSQHKISRGPPLLLPSRKDPNSAKILKEEALLLSIPFHHCTFSLCSWFLDFPVRTCYPQTPFYNFTLLCLLLGTTLNLMGTKEKISRLMRES
jgi:hypothetical protein